MTPITPMATAVPPDSGRREQRKQRTRDALIQAALDLFATHGYDHTAVHEITDAVDVSERTFFRYFASKEDLVLSFAREGMAAFAQELAARPPREEPLTAARRAFHAMLRRPGAAGAGTGAAREGSGAAGDVASYLAVMELIDSTPVLLAAHLRYIHDHDEEVIGVLARREGIDPATDLRPRLLAAVIGTLVFLANRDWRAGSNHGPEALAAAFDSYAEAALPALAGHWSDPR